MTKKMIEQIQLYNTSYVNFCLSKLEMTHMLDPSDSDKMKTLFEATILFWFIIKRYK